LNARQREIALLKPLVHGYFGVNKCFRLGRCKNLQDVSSIIVWADYLKIPVAFPVQSFERSLKPVFPFDQLGDLFFHASQILGEKF
jgi:hypothetical protein